jgi:hypothetical protein
MVCVMSMLWSSPVVAGVCGSKGKEERRKGLGYRVFEE